MNRIIFLMLIVAGITSCNSTTNPESIPASAISAKDTLTYEYKATYSSDIDRLVQYLAKQ